MVKVTSSGFTANPLSHHADSVSPANSPPQLPEPVPLVDLSESSRKGGMRNRPHASLNSQVLGLQAVPSQRGKHVRVRSHADGESVINAWLAKRPSVQSETSLGNDGKLVRYNAVNHEPLAPRNEAFFTSVPGMLMAVLTVHPEMEHGISGDITADAVAARLAEPPIGLLTGVWQSSHDRAYLERGGVVHTANMEERWAPLTLPGMDPREPLRMTGLQADGGVYLHNGSQLWRLTETAAESVTTENLPEGAAVRIGAGGEVHGLHEGALHSNGISRPVELWRPKAGAPGSEQSPARPVDLLPLPGGTAALILDDKGRIYHADLKGTGAVEAHRLKLPADFAQGKGWAVTAMGLSRDETVHLMLQDQNGRRMSLQRAPGEALFRPAYLLDRPLLLLYTEGLHVPSEAAVQSHVQLDGHAQLGHIDGVLHYKAAPDQSWERLKQSGGEPLTGVTALYSSPLGFIDRKPVFALVGDARQVVELKLEGRTSWLPSDAELPRYPAGGPLAVIPDTVALRSSLIAQFDEPVQALAVHGNRRVVALTDSGRLMAADADSPARRLPTLQRPVAIAVGLNDQLLVLHHPHSQRPQLKRLSANDDWEPVPIILPGSVHPSSLRATRTGQIQLQLGENWHTLLPSMTSHDNQSLPARVKPEPERDEAPSENFLAGSNALANQQQASRISTPHHDASVVTSLLGTTANNPLTAASSLQAVVDTTRAQVGALARDVVGAAANSAMRSMAHTLGVVLPPTPQEKRLASFHHEAKQAYTSGKILFEHLPTLAQVRVASAVGPSDGERFGLSHQQTQRLLTLREGKLEALLRDLRKIGFHEGVIMGDMGDSDSAHGLVSTTSTPTFRLAELWRRQHSRVDKALSSAGLSRSEDIFPDLNLSINALAGGAALHADRMSEREAELLSVLCEVSEKMMRAGVRLPADDGSVDSAHSQAPYGLRTAGLIAGLVDYDALLSSTDAQALEMTERLQQDARLAALCKLGLSSWGQLAAFDDVVTTFREQISLPGSARRTQLLKNLGLPPDAAPDEMAARMSDLLLDLFNRSTFFSTQSRGLELRGSLGSADWKHLNAFSVGVTGEALQVLGVERIGDGKDGDAGLVAFFVRHAKASVSATSGIGIDFKPGPGTGGRVIDSRPGRSMNSTWGGSANLGISGAYQHGQGAAVIIAPSTISDFVRLLFDVNHPDTTQILRTGVNGGSIGLDLFETNVNASVGANVSVSPFSLSQKYGPQKPTADAAVSGPDNRRSTASGSLSVGGTAQAGAHWGQMELHLDHAWADIIGLEFQGRTDFNLEFNSGLNLGGALSSALGDNPQKLINASTGNGNLQLAGIRVASSDVQLPTDAAVDDKRRGPFLSTASYKRTFDTEVAKSVTAGEWGQMRQRLAKAFPDNIAELGALDYPTGPGERIATIKQVIDRIQGAKARSVEAVGAMDGKALRRQRLDAAREMSNAGNSVWRASSEIERASIVEMLHHLRQQEQSAVQNHARAIPGARVEFNLFGRESLETVVFHAIGHLGLGSKLNDLAELRRKVPGLDQVMLSFQSLPKVNQVRYVFEMRPQARFAINDALLAREQQASARALGLQGPSGSELNWRGVLDKIKTTPDLYRLAAIAVHNTDENPVTSRIGLPLLNVSATGATSHQLFEAEIQFRYGLYDGLQGVELLEAGNRALQSPLRALQQSGIQALGQRTQAGEVAYGPPSPRKESPLRSAVDAAALTTNDMARQLEVKVQRMNTAHEREANAISSFQQAYGIASAHLDRLLLRIPELPLPEIDDRDADGGRVRGTFASLQRHHQALDDAISAMHQASEKVYTIPGKRTPQEQDPALAQLLSVEKRRRSLGHALETLAGRGVEAGTATGLELNRVSSQVNDLVARRDALLRQRESGVREGGLDSEELEMELQLTTSVLQRLRADLLGERQAMEATAKRLDQASRAALEGERSFSDAVRDRAWGELDNA
ncbi:Type III effector hopR1 [Pseudomonas syringae pv. delphinii]|uniref:Type III effector hopR1 n=2 Tax=Pseudomonas syringae group genomosp. 3 TaxID=251701 RepID=A0A0P9PMQ5_9PSED|nr:Type III effector hopR1 [Pseudomonas syringae pv. delphinii]RMP15875.1 Type III effector hopR1 [Pseudomonas syringae pv. delphinii]RMP24250.1 Type III effector HopR1 [Pseudomonas syringae pv. delphinii]RMQ17314.1 Type III effector hopR1 [Pseudomonas syringae pv. delphinii]